MNIIHINSFNIGSTGNIMIQLADAARERGDNVYICCPSCPDNWKKKLDHQIYIGNYFSKRVHQKLFEYTGYNDCFSVLSTINFLRKLKTLQPNIIHLHNLHNCYINLPILFRYIKRNNIKVVWTLHDCWALTGQCPYFTLAKCDKWKTGCHDCPQIHVYPSAIVDRTKTMWKLKKKWFTGVENMTIVTPSQWLADLVKQSYLKEYPVKVIHNGIDLSVFKPTPSDFREKHGISPEKKVLLGVAFGWGRRKGLDVFIELAKRLSNEYQIVLVGTDENTDKLLPENVISIHRTENQQQLAEIYTAADVFVNPTREENYPTVNMESLACGTPVITFTTGGSPEIPDVTCGSVVPVDDIDALEAEIVRVCTQRPYTREACLKRAQTFDMNDRFEEYVKLYEELQ